MYTRPRGTRERGYAWHPIVLRVIPDASRTPTLRASPSARSETMPATVAWGWQFGELATMVECRSIGETRRLAIRDRLAPSSRRIGQRQRPLNLPDAR
eukprot:7953031-Pyramimonas_sp.AAC.1